MTNAMQTVLGGTECIWLGKEFLTRLECGSWLSSCETIPALECKLSRKNRCTQCFLFLILCDVYTNNKMGSSSNDWIY
jgi:hypothetical protein